MGGKCEGIRQIQIDLTLTARLFFWLIWRMQCARFDFKIFFQKYLGIHMVPCEALPLLPTLLTADSSPTILTMDSSSSSPSSLCKHKKIQTEYFTDGCAGPVCLIRIKFCASSKCRTPSLSDRPNHLDSSCCTIGYPALGDSVFNKWWYWALCQVQFYL